MIKRIVFSDKYYDPLPDDCCEDCCNCDVDIRKDCDGACCGCDHEDKKDFCDEHDKKVKKGKL